MPVSTKRHRKKKGSPIAHKINSTVTSSYVDDFMDEVVAGLPSNQYCLVSVLQEENHKKYYYVLSRNPVGSLVEHNEGPAFIKSFINVLNNYKETKSPVKIIVGYFTREQVSIEDEGLDFRTPSLALQWKTQNSQFVPDETYYEWNGYIVKPGMYVDRTF